MRNPMQLPEVVVVSFSIFLCTGYDPQPTLFSPRDTPGVAHNPVLSSILHTPGEGLYSV